MTHPQTQLMKTPIATKATVDLIITFKFILKRNNDSYEPVPRKRKSNLIGENQFSNFIDDINWTDRKNEGENTWQMIAVLWVKAANILENKNQLDFDGMLHTWKHRHFCRINQMETKYLFFHKINDRFVVYWKFINTHVCDRLSELFWFLCYENSVRVYQLWIKAFSSMISDEVRIWIHERTTSVDVLIFHEKSALSRYQSFSKTFVSRHILDFYESTETKNISISNILQFYIFLAKFSIFAISFWSN